ncbi:MAG TPA: paraquat-inducible protein A [Candidatus Binataceae bacterium]|nr:paraquat-inducible protein A [Candidatus Binataceae bacterium]
MASESTFNVPAADRDLVGCPQCDLLQRVPDASPGEAIRCARCSEELVHHREDALNRTLALAAAATILYLVANTVPMIGLSVVGRGASTTVIGGAQHLWNNGQKVVGALVLFTAVIAPALQIGLTFAISIGARRDPVPKWVGPLLRWSGTAVTWSMIEVMLLGVLVALVKIADYATVIPGTALFTLGGLVVILAAMQISLERRDIWERIEWLDPSASSQAPYGNAGRGPTAMQQGMQSCETCELLSYPAEPDAPGRCPRCGGALEFRKTASLQRTWAFLIAAAVCYIPANMLPVLVTTTATGTDSDTILQGVVLLWSPTGWPLSLIVLFASIMIPSAKILALGYLLVSVQSGSVKSNEQRVRLYRMVEIIGRWSMVDVFVDTFTAALVQLQPLMAVEPGPGLVFFAAVVVLTMLAVECFDPRLIWDATSSLEASYAQ